MTKLSLLNQRYLSALYFSALLSLFQLPMHAYPEFQSFIEQKSGRSVDCAVCHSNSNGPVGSNHGQIASLSPKDLEALNSARMALEPGMLKKDNPVLNRLGNSIMKKLGKKKLLEYRKEPEKLADALKDSDLDQDGISDGQEYLDGSDPLNKMHGDPWKLFCVNLDRNKTHLLLAALACFLLDWGFVKLIRGFALTSKARKSGIQVK